MWFQEKQRLFLLNSDNYFLKSGPEVKSWHEETGWVPEI